ncbi:MAG: 2-C-methyl-D-erythritol 4-phosphate cytidylyltransferase [Desulfobacteraceae bacterium 4572_123]|nr:MAG: 2-C-methyl-D-erythritol 4-phosphate cytidylyltransferase [Desulfobacteraceae bacterium 4572_123]
MNAAAVIVAAGKGNRMRGDIRKQYLLLGGRPILWYSLKTFESCREINHISLCIPEQDFDFCRSNILTHLDFPKKIILVPGGAHRQESVYNGIMAIDCDMRKNGIIVIHDGVRPFIKAGDITECIKWAASDGACILGIPATDTLKSVNSRGCVTKTLSRNRVWMAQTPQAFQCDLIKRAHEKARQKGFTGTDDAQLVELTGQAVKVIRGSGNNIKITTRQDLVLARALHSISGI